MAAAAVVVPAVAVLTAGAGARPRPDQTPRDAPCCAKIVSSAQSVPTAGHYVVIEPPEKASFAVSRRAASRAHRPTLPAGVAPERGLQIETVLVARAISATFPEIHDIGGVRSDALRWHPDGLAIDVMIPHYGTAAGRALGDRIVAFALANADRFALNHVIWRQVFYPPHGRPHRMADRGSDNANHYNHVHIATNGGGYPTGSEIYFG